MIASRIGPALAGGASVAFAALVVVAGCSSGRGPTPRSVTAAGLGPSGSSEALATELPSPSPRRTLAPPAITPIPGAPSSSLTVHLVAKSGTWSAAAITAPAGTTWHVEIDDRDAGEAHNFTIEVGPELSDRIFHTANFNKGVSTFEIAAFPAGTYTFICTLHPTTMVGTLTLGGG
jgi:plastocyanin